MQRRRGSPSLAAPGAADEGGEGGASAKRARQDSPTHSIEHLLTPSASAPATPAPASPVVWTTLPRDLLALIFAAVPLRPRLLVVSIVCRRWRALALSVPAALPSLQHARLKQALALLPHVTSLRDLPIFPASALPTGLRELHVRADAPALPLPAAALSGLTALTLDLRAPRALYESLLPLPHAASPLASLTSLTLVRVGEGAVLWPAACLPRLAALSVEAACATPADLAPLTQLLSVHASSLASLRLTHEAHAQALADAHLRFPRLTHLHSLWLPADFDTVAPMLRTAGLRLSSVPAALPYPALVELDLSGMAPFDVCNISISHLLVPTVHTLGLPSLEGMNLEVHPCVRALKLRKQTAIDRLERHFPSLTALHLLGFVRYPCKDLATLFDGLACQDLNLRTLHAFTLPHSATDEALEALGDALRTLEARGVECVRLGVSYGRELPWLAAVAARLRWLDVDLAVPD